MSGNKVYPFGQLSPEEQKVLEDTGGPYEAYMYDPHLRCSAWSRVYHPGDLPRNSSHLAWRVAQFEATIEWSHAHQDYNYLAEMANGVYRLFKVAPVLNGFKSDWEVPYNSRLADTFSSFRPGNRSWRDSVVKRPSH